MQVHIDVYDVYVSPSITVFISCYKMQLAALENAGWEQAVTNQGDEHYDVIFPKYKRGGYIVKKVTVIPTYGKI